MHVEVKKIITMASIVSHNYLDVAIICNDISEMDMFTSTVTGKTFKVNYRLNFGDKKFICFLRCNYYRKLCLDNTEVVDSFRYCWSNYKYNDLKFTH